jgi:arabinofuranosyltransferase
MQTRGSSARAAGGGRLAMRLRFVGILGLLVIGVISRSRYWDYCLHDDAFISFRYARNLVRGEGLVMNPGEHVEGFTNFLWTVLVAPVLQWGGRPEAFTQLVGSVLALGLVAGLWWFSERRLRSGWFSLVAPAFLIGNLAFVMESLSGLETLAFSGLLFVTVVSFLEERRSNAARPGLWAAWAAAATLVRPEGGLVFAVLCAYALLGIVRGERAGSLGRALAVYAVLLLPFLAFRLLYYGALLPNTFYVKVGTTTAQLARGWRYTQHVLAFALTPVLLLGSLFLAAIAVVRPVGRRPAVASDTVSDNHLFGSDARREALAVTLLLCVVYLLYVLAVGGDYEPTARFYMPVLPWIYLLVQEGGRTLFLLGRRRGGQLAVVAAFVVALLLGWGLFESSKRFILLLSSRGWPMSRWEHHQELRTVGEWLRHNTAPGTTIALSSIGALPWYADRPIIDMMGLTDAHIGRKDMPRMGQGPAGHEKGDGAYVLQRRPDIILLDRGHLFDHQATWNEIRAGARGVSELELVQNPEFLRLYELHRAPTAAGILHWFQRRDADVGPSR